MAPTYDNDVAEERFKSTEWINYELWERLQVKIRRKKMLWVFLAFLLFMVLSSIPILVDRWPKIVSVRGARELASLITHIKTLAAGEHQAARLRFLPGNNETRLAYVVEVSDSCQGSNWRPHSKGQLLSTEIEGHYTVLAPEQGLLLNIPRLVTEFCYDSITAPTIGPMVGFAVAAVKDLTEKRVDRTSVVLLSGPFAEVSFD